MFLKKEYTVERSITIQQPKEVVFDYIKYIKNQNEFSVWASLDPNMEEEFEGTDGEVGFIHSWEGNKKVGIGEQEITNIVEDERFETELRFTEPMESSGQAHMTTTSTAENNTEVLWGMKGKMAYPWNIMNPFMDSMLGKDLQQGLDNLKDVMGSGETAQTGSKEFLNNYFQSTANRLQSVVSGFSEEQLSFLPNDSTWSVAQVLEHIVTTEAAILQMVKQNFQSESIDTTRTEIPTDQEFIAMVTDRSQKGNAPEMLQPTGKYANLQAVLNEFTTTRDSIQQFIQQTPIETMRAQISDSPAGTIDGYQNLLLIPAHTERHTKQIEEVMANQEFPN